jgi:hypothetical protein
MKAYPFQHKNPTSGLTTASEGMELRDWFAGLAMEAFMSGWIERNIYPPNDSDVAEHAYRMADAMIKQRKDVPNE